MPCIARTLAALLVLSGCASHPGPIVDLKGVDPDRYASDLEDCEGYADAVQPGRAAAKGAGARCSRWGS